MSKFSKGDIVKCKKTGQYFKLLSAETMDIDGKEVRAGWQLGSIDLNLVFLPVENLELYEESDEKV